MLAQCHDMAMKTPAERRFGRPKSRKNSLFLGDQYAALWVETMNASRQASCARCVMHFKAVSTSRSAQCRELAPALLVQVSCRCIFDVPKDHVRRFRVSVGELYRLHDGQSIKSGDQYATSMSWAAPTRIECLDNSAATDASMPAHVVVRLINRRLSDFGGPPRGGRPTGHF